MGDAGHARWIDDIQLAVQASFFTLSDPDLGMRLLAATASVWFQRSLMDEYRTRAEMALEKAADLAEQPDATVMRLWHSLGLCYWHIKGTGPEVARAFRHTYDLARRLRNVDFERMALWGLCAESCTSGDYAAALGFAREHAALTPPGPDPEADIQGRHMMQVSLHLMGDQASSQDEATSALEPHPPDRSPPPISARSPLGNQCVPLAGVVDSRPSRSGARGGRGGRAVCKIDAT